MAASKYDVYMQKDITPSANSGFGVVKHRHAFNEDFNSRAN